MEAIKPRQIINYDAGIVLIDLHQQRKNNFRQYKSATLNTGQPHVNEERTRKNNNPQHPLSNQMIEQINIALEQKGSEFLSLGHWSLPSEITSEKREHIHQLKNWWRMNIRVLPSEQDDIVNSLNYEHCSNWVAVYTPDSDRLRVGSVTD